jgi:hypothetical protein
MNQMALRIWFGSFAGLSAAIVERLSLSTGKGVDRS